jgi:hypothetical protein
VGVVSALFIGATYDYNSIISNSTPCPSWVMLVEVLQCRNQV